MAKTSKTENNSAISPQMKDLISGFLFHLNSRHKRSLTLRAYSSDLRLACIHLARRFEGVDLINAQEENLRDYFLDLKKRHTAATTRRRLATLKVFYCWLNKERPEVRTDNPTLVIPSSKIETHRKITPMSEEEFELVLEKVKVRGREGSLFAMRDAVIVEILAETGILISRLLVLNLGGCFVHSNLGGPDTVELRISKLSMIRKSGIQLSEKTSKHLLDYIKLAHEDRRDKNERPVFLNRRGGRVSERSIRRFLSVAKGKAGLSRPFSPRELRYLFVSRFIRSREALEREGRGEGGASIESRLAEALRCSRGCAGNIIADIMIPQVPCPA